MTKQVTLAKVEARIGVLAAKQIKGIYGAVEFKNGSEIDWDGDSVDQAKKKVAPYVNKNLTFGLKSGTYGWEYVEAGADGNIFIDFTDGSSKIFDGKQGFPKFIKWLMTQK